MRKHMTFKVDKKTETCPCCGGTVAEGLMDLLKMADLTRDRVTSCGDMEVCNRLNIAKKLKARGDGVVFRAVFEGWSLSRIVQEVY